MRDKGLRHEEGGTIVRPKKRVEISVENDPKIDVLRNNADWLFSGENAEVVDVLRENKEKLIAQALEKVQEYNSDKKFHSEVHTGNVIDFSQVIARDIARELGYSDDQIQVLIDICAVAAAYHDIIMEDDVEDGETVKLMEEKSYELLAENLFSLFSEEEQEAYKKQLSDVLSEMREAILSTKAEGDFVTDDEAIDGKAPGLHITQFDPERIADNYDMDLAQENILALIMATADLSHFGLTTAKKSLEFSLRVDLEEIHALKDNFSVEDLAKFLQGQIQVFENYNWPEGLPEKLRNKYSDEKDFEVVYYQAVITDLELNREKSHYFLELKDMHGKIKNNSLEKYGF